MASPENIDLSTKDKNGYAPITNLIGQTVQHTGNNLAFRVAGFTWLGDLEEWGVSLMRSDGLVHVVDSMKRFYGQRKNDAGQLENRLKSLVTPDGKLPGKDEFDELIADAKKL